MKKIFIIFIFLFFQNNSKAQPFHEFAEKEYRQVENDYEAQNFKESKNSLQNSALFGILIKNRANNLKMPRALFYPSGVLFRDKNNRIFLSFSHLKRGFILLNNKKIETNHPGFKLMIKEMSDAIEDEENLISYKIADFIYPQAHAMAPFLLAIPFAISILANIFNKSSTSKGDTSLPSIKEQQNQLHHKSSIKDSSFEALASLPLTKGLSQISPHPESNKTTAVAKELVTIRNANENNPLGEGPGSKESKVNDYGHSSKTLLSKIKNFINPNAKKVTPEDLKKLENKGIIGNNSHSSTSNRLKSSATKCLRYVKLILLKSKKLKEYPDTLYAKDIGPVLEQNGYIKSSIKDPLDAPPDAVVVYDYGKYGHVEVIGEDNKAYSDVERDLINEKINLPVKAIYI